MAPLSARPDADVESVDGTGCTLDALDCEDATTDELGSGEVSADSDELSRRLWLAD